MSNNRPKITDKIRFWEEQDKINNALIPRVLQVHENQKKQLRLNSTLTSDISKIKLRVADLTERIKTNDELIEELDESVKKQKIETNKLTQEINKNISFLNSSFNKLNFKVSSFHRSQKELYKLLQNNEILLKDLSKEIDRLKLYTSKTPFYISMIAILIALLSFLF